MKAIEINWHWIPLQSKENLHRQDNSIFPEEVHQVEDPDNASEKTVCRCRTVTSPLPLHILHSSPDAHPTINNIYNQ